MFGVEDPFDAFDNCARSVRASDSSGIAKEFAAAATHMLDVGTANADACKLRTCRRVTSSLSTQAQNL